MIVVQTRYTFVPSDDLMVSRLLLLVSIFVHGTIVELFILSRLDKFTMFFFFSEWGSFFFKQAKKIHEMREWNEKKLTETVLISGFGRKIHIRANDSEKKSK